MDQPVCLKINSTFKVLHCVSINFPNGSFFNIISFCPCLFFSEYIKGNNNFFLMATS